MGKANVGLAGQELLDGLEPLPPDRKGGDYFAQHKELYAKNEDYNLQFQAAGKWWVADRDRHIEPAENSDSKTPEQTYPYRLGAASTM
ncbi:hypothetical protein [Streptomyces sp. NPDC001851]|uniref:hypothetical protein n=1 Tax=Streptomyces sp. NPDC001851 TaxID=3154529 RepID=UPI00332B8A9B